jgi:hypothetical protein
MCASSSPPCKACHPLSAVLITCGITRLLNCWIDGLRNCKIAQLLPPEIGGRLESFSLKKMMRGFPRAAR